MYKIYLFTSILSFTLPHFSKASDSLAVNLFVLKTDLIAIPAPIFFEHEHYLSITIEKSLWKKQSTQLVLLYDWRNEDYHADKTFEVIPEYKFYFNKTGKGFFIGLYLKYALYREWLYEKYGLNNVFYGPEEKLYIEYEKQSIAAGPIMGYQQTFKKHLTLEFILGFGFKKIISEKTLFGSPGLITDETNDDAVLALNLGYKF